MKNHSAGYALLLMLLLLASTGVLTLRPFVRTLADTPGAQALHNARVLKQAREALLAYAAMEDNSPGSLPCPDQDQDGWAQDGIGHPCRAPYIGQLPWKTLGLGMLTDAHSACLWYSVAAEFRNTIQTRSRGNSSATPAINPSQSGSLILKSTAGNSPLIAAVFAPGSAINGQPRPSNGPASCAAGSTSVYLELENASGIAARIAPTSSSFNDSTAAIDANALFSLAGRRVLLALAQGEPYVGAGLPLFFNTQSLAHAGQLQDNSQSPTAQSPATRVARFSLPLYAAFNFDDALQAANPVAGRVFYRRSSNEAGQICNDYQVWYTALNGNQSAGSGALSGVSVAPAEWLCRNQWYAHIGYQASGSHQALLSLQPAAGATPLTLALQF